MASVPIGFGLDSGLFSFFNTRAKRSGAETSKILRSGLRGWRNWSSSIAVSSCRSSPAPGGLVLDDYHLVDAKPVDASTSVDDALTFLLERQSPQMHLVITTREDPPLPLARYRARGR
jgi:hypothetical protein